MPFPHLRVPSPYIETIGADGPPWRVFCGGNGCTAMAGCGSGEQQDGLGRQPEHYMRSLLTEKRRDGWEAISRKLRAHP